MPHDPVGAGSGESRCPDPDHAGLPALARLVVGWDTEQHEPIGIILVSDPPDRSSRATASTAPVEPEVAHGACQQPCRCQGLRRAPCRLCGEARRWAVHDEPPRCPVAAPALHGRQAVRTRGQCRGASGSGDANPPDRSKLREGSRDGRTRISWPGRPPVSRVHARRFDAGPGRGIGRGCVRAGTLGADRQLSNRCRLR